MVAGRSERQDGAAQGEPLRARLPARRGAVRAARHWATARAAELGVRGDAIRVVELLTSELVANAILHAMAEEIEVSAVLRDGHFTVGVTDAGAGMPVVRTTGPEVPGGQGLRLVERLADRSGVDRHEPAGKTVWFSIAAHTSA